jgi:GPN-loop GTPase
MKHAQLVLGPAGSGKTQYCSNMQDYLIATKQAACHIINLDPAAEAELPYSPAADVRDLLQTKDVAEEMKLGPNGALIECMEFLVSQDGLEWLDEILDSFSEDAYILFDLPGQIELYSNYDTVRRLVKFLEGRGQCRCCGVYLIDAMFVTDPTKFMSGCLASLAAMIRLEIAWINILSKGDLMAKRAEGEEIVPEMYELRKMVKERGIANPEQVNLSMKVCDILEEFSPGVCILLNFDDEDNVDAVLREIHNSTNYGEDLEPRESDYLDQPEVDQDKLQHTST